MLRIRRGWSGTNTRSGPFHSSPDCKSSRYSAKDTTTRGRLPLFHLLFTRASLDSSPPARIGGVAVFARLAAQTIHSTNVRNGPHAEHRRRTMRRSLILLSLLVSYPSAPGTSPRRAETFGDWSAPVNVASLNTAYNDMYAVLSKDELTVYFTSDRPGPTSAGGDDLWFATRESVDAPWGPAQNMGEPINSLFADSLPMLSYDEHVMFFHSTRPGGCGLTGTGDIWMVRRHNRRSQEWEPPANLGCGLNRLNTDSTEIAPAFFEDPENEQVTLFYGSNRSGSLDFDVYASAMGEDGYFGSGLLVPEFSSRKRDTRIFIRKDGLEAFITSNRDNGHGLIDIWTSTRET